MFGITMRVPRFSVWTYFTMAVSTIAVIKGVRLPNLWAATQLQIDYTFGFVKRGAAGALFNLLHVPIEHYWVYATLSFAIIAAAIAVFSIFIGHKTTSPECAYFTTVFVSSFAVTYFVNMVGFIDILLLAMTTTILLIRSSRSSVAIIYAACVAMILIHEAFLLSFFPVICFRLFLEATFSPPETRRETRFHLIALPVIIAITTVVIALPRPLTEEQISLMQTAIMAKVDFPLRTDFFEVMRTSTAESVRAMLARFLVGSVLFQHVGATLSLLWLVAFFTWRSILVVQRQSIHSKPWLIAAVVCSSLSPTLLQFVGHDLFRWYATASFTAFMTYVLIVRCLNVPENTEAPGNSEMLARNKTLAMALVALNLSTGAGLFNHDKVNTFPFYDEVRDLVTTYKALGTIPIPTL